MRNHLKPVAGLLGAAALAVSALLSGCATQDQPTLVDTFWKLQQVDGQNVFVDDGQRQPYLLLLEHGQRLQGYASCNSVAGRYDDSGDPKQLHFHTHISSHSHCPGNMQIEHAYLAALSQTDGETIEGNTLVLRDSDNRVLARFSALGTG